jgi:hypothetical protein
MGARSSKNTTQNNRSDGHLLEYFRNTFVRGGGGTNAPPPPPPPGLTATGGVISDYSDPGPGAIYRAHIFTSSGIFDVSAPGDFGDTVEYLVVAGGGGGGVHNAAGGGGAGGYRTNVSGHPLAPTNLHFQYLLSCLYSNSWCWWSRCSNIKVMVNGTHHIWSCTITSMEVVEAESLE